MSSPSVVICYHRVPIDCGLHVCNVAVLSPSHPLVGRLIRTTVTDLPVTSPGRTPVSITRPSVGPRAAVRLQSEPGRAWHVPQRNRPGGRRSCPLQPGREDQRSGGTGVARVQVRRGAEDCRGAAGSRAVPAGSTSAQTASLHHQQQSASQPRGGATITETGRARTGALT